MVDELFNVLDSFLPCKPADSSVRMESERTTRKSRIDPLLKSLGWKIVPFDENRPLDQLSNCAIEEYETENGPAD